MATYQIIQPDAANTTYNIGDGTICQLSYPAGISGIGIPNVQRDIQRHPNIEGAIDHGYRLEPREINLNLYYNVANEALADTRRDAIYKIFRPFDAPLKLRVTRGDGSVRQIDVHTIGVTDLSSAERVGNDQGFSVRLLAPVPIWYYPTQQSVTINPGITNWGFNLAYTGTWDDYPIIKVIGSATNFSLQIVVTTADDVTTYNLGTWTVPAGDTFTFDLRPGYKTVKNNAGVSQLGYGAAENTFIFLYGMRLFADPIMPGGVNLLNGFFTAKDANHRVQVLWYNRYLGL